MAATDHVLDASALAKRFLDQSHAADYRAWHAKAILRSQLVAPNLIRYELGQVLSREAGSDLEVRASLLRHVLAGLAFEDPEPGQPFAFTPPLSYYDAAYLALAKGRSCTLVTYDAKLLKAAKANDVPTLSPGTA